MSLLSLLPPDISLVDAVIIIIAGFVTSGITAAFGLGGGVTFLAVLASVVPTPAIIPIHGLVQVGSNLSRMVLQFAHTNWQVVVYFVAGSIVGAVIGGHLVVELPDRVLKGVLALFILYATWGPMRFRLSQAGPKTLVVTGAVSTFLTMFLGATGPFVVSIIAPLLKDRHEYVATHAVCMLLQHSMKIVIFSLLGFAFYDWLPLVAVTILVSFGGTAIGIRLLTRLPETDFRKVLRTILSVLALNLLAGALGLFG